MTDQPGILSHPGRQYLTVRLSQICRDDLFLVALLGSAAAKLLDLLGHKQLLDLVQDSLFRELVVLFFPFLRCRSVRSPVAGFRGIDLVPVERLELLLGPHNWQANAWRGGKGWLLR